MGNVSLTPARREPVPSFVLEKNNESERLIEGRVSGFGSIEQPVIRENRQNSESDLQEERDNCMQRCLGGTKKAVDSDCVKATVVGVVVTATCYVGGSAAVAASQGGKLAATLKSFSGIPLLPKVVSVLAGCFSTGGVLKRFEEKKHQSQVTVAAPTTPPPAASVPPPPITME